MEITVGGEQVFIPPVHDIPTGSFFMGSGSTDLHINPDEIPQTSINVNDFKIGTFDVTVAEYSRATSAQAVKEPSTVDNLTWQQQLEHLDYPVVGVSWDECVAYAKWLASKTGKPWRLPTEAEWEKAARGNDRRIYPWGNDWDPKKANTNESTLGHPTPVGTYPDANEVSPHGAQDMAGNVGEWTSSLYRRYPYNATDGRENPNAPLDTPNAPNSRVFRGGSFNSAKEFARTASRSNGSPISHRRDVGFRMAQG